MRRFLSLLFTVGLLLGTIVPAASAAPVVPTNNAYQTVPFAQNWSDTTLLTTDNNWTNVPGIIGYRGDDITTSTGTDPRTLLTEGTGTPINVIANQTSPNTNTNGGIAEFEIADPVVALQGSGTADAPFILIHVTTTGYQSINISYDLRDVDGSTDNAVQPIALHYRVGATGNFTNLAGGYVSDATTGPSLANLVTSVNVTLPPAADNQAQVQLRIMTTNAVGSDEWVGVDNISIAGTPITADAAPTVTTATPTGSGVPINSAIVVNFSEFVDVTAGGITVECPAGIGVSLSGLPATNVTSVTLTHTTDFPAGTTCTGKVTKTAVTDRDGTTDPMANDYTWTFTTDAAPAVSSATPTGMAVAVNSSLVVNFSESVSVIAGGVTLECPTGTPVTLSGLPANSVSSLTLTPSGSLPYGVTCTGTVIATSVSDQDANDPPNNMTSNYTWTFTTVSSDTAPVVSSTTPDNSATGVLTNANLTVNFSEAVNVNGSWYNINCGTSGAHSADVTGGPSTFTLNPATDFTPGESCTGTIYATQVTDQDSNDPPDAMTTDYIWNWTVAPLSVCSELFFSEYVEGSSNNKALEIFNGSTSTVNLSGYSVELYSNGASTATNTANLSGTIAPGDVYVIANSAASAAIQNVADLLSTVTNYNGDDAIALLYNGAPIDVIGQIGFDPGTAWGSGMTSMLDHTLRRKATISAGDTDGSNAFEPSIEWDGYPQDNISDLGSHTASCGLDVPPTVASTLPANGATGVSTGANVNITFSEAVTASGAWQSISCTSSGSHPVAITGGPTTYTLNPDTDFTAGENCTVIVNAAQVVDLDGAPDQMTTNYGFSFTVASTDPCSGAADLIHDIQGSGTTSPVSAQSKTIMGLVTGDFETGLKGYFVQEESTDWDANAATSEGIFVYDGNTSSDVSVGDKVRVTGSISEYGDRTVGGGTLTQLSSPTNLIVCSSGNTVTPADITLPEATNGDLERYEGMLVRVTTTMTVVDNYYLGRYGQMGLSGAGRLYQPTNQYTPGSAEAIELAAANARAYLTMDDGKAGVRCGDNPNPVPYLAGPPPAVIRSGDTVTNLVGVLDYGQIDSGATGTCSSGTTLFAGDYRLHPTQTPSFATANPRPESPAALGGNVRVVGANLLNFFNGNGVGGGFPTSRGATNFTEFVRQRIKLYEELSKLNGDVVTLMEVENDGFGADSAIAELVKVLNEGPCWNSSTECANLGYSSSGMGAGTYAFVNMNSPIGTDQITVGVIYKPSKVTIVGTPAALTATGYTDPNNTGSQKSRPALAASFEVNVGGERFTVVANHLKSKGSCPTTTGPDADQGDGQGCWNDTRKKGATYLVNTWLPSDPTGAGDPDFLLLGDMNAYAKEDPITAMLAGGYTNVVLQQAGATAYSYAFDGQFGYLDHALASSSLTSQVTGALEYHVNSDEPPVIDYNTDFNPAGYYTANQYRASDHDPVLVALNLQPDYSENATYGQAWHTGQGVWRLGANWSGTPDGVQRGATDSWNDTRGEVYVTVNGPVAGQKACLNAWLDYSDGTAVDNVVETPNGMFDGNEHVINNQSIAAGATDQLVTFTLPLGVMNATATYNMRFRLVADPNNDGNCTDVTASPAFAPDAPAGAASPVGGATTGEVEDYGFAAGPLAVNLASFTVRHDPTGEVLEWETVSETDNAGFNVYRGASPSGPWKLMTPALIPAAAPGSTEGHAYAWTDTTAATGGEYWYVLEAVDVSGGTERFGPIAPVTDGPNAIALSGLRAEPLSAAPVALPLLALLGLGWAGWRRRK